MKKKTKNKNLHDKALYDGKDVFPLYIHAYSNYRGVSIREMADLRYIEPISELVSTLERYCTTYVETVTNDKDSNILPYTAIWGQVNSIKDSKRCQSVSKIAISTTKQPRD